MKRIIRGIRKTVKSGTAATRRQGLRKTVHAELGQLDARLGEVNETLSAHSEPPAEFWEYRKRGEHHHKLHPTYVEFMETRVALRDEKELLEARRKMLVSRLRRIEGAGKKG